MTDGGFEPPIPIRPDDGWGVRSTYTHPDGSDIKLSVRMGFDDGGANYLYPSIRMTDGGFESPILLRSDDGWGV